MLLAILLVVAVVLMPVIAAFAEDSLGSGTVHGSDEDEPEPVLP